MGSKDWPLPSFVNFGMILIGYDDCGFFWRSSQGQAKERSYARVMKDLLEIRAWRFVDFDRKFFCTVPVTVSSFPASYE